MIQNLRQALQLLELRYSESIDEVLLVSTSKITVIGVENLDEREILYQLTPQFHYREVIASIRLNYRQQRSEPIGNLDENLVTDLGISMVEYLAYRDHIDFSAVQDLIALLNRDNREEIIEFGETYSDPMLHHITRQIRNSVFQTSDDLNVEIELLFNLLSHLSSPQYDSYHFLVRLLNREFNLKLMDIPEYTNFQLLRYLAEDAPGFLYDRDFIFSIFLYIFVYEVQRITRTVSFINVLNTFIFILSESNVSIEILFRLRSLGIKFYLEFFTSKSSGELHEDPYFDQFRKFYQNWINIYRDLSEVQQKSKSEEIENVQSNFIDTFMEIRSDSDDVWQQFVLRDIRNILNYYTFVSELVENDDLRTFKGTDDFLSEIHDYFNINDSYDGYYLFLLRLCLIIIDIFLHNTKYNPDDLTGSSIYTLIDRSLDNLDNSLIEKYERQYEKLVVIEIQKNFQNIIFGKLSAKTKFDRLVSFFEKESDKLMEQIYYPVKQFRALWWVIDHIHELEPQKIHLFLDILDLRSTNAYNRTTVLKDLIRSFLNEEQPDPLTWHFLDQYLDNPQDDTDVSREFLREIANNLSDKDNVEIDSDDLKLEMELEMDLKDKGRDNDNLAGLPPALFEVLDDDGSIPDYFIFFHTYHHARRQLAMTNIDDELRELMKYLLNHHPYRERLNANLRKITTLRHDNDEIVDDIKFELLEIEIMAKIFPEEALHRLVNYYKDIIDQRLNPTVDDYREIIRLYQMLVEKVGRHDRFEEFMVLSRQIEIFESHLTERYQLQEVMDVVHKITTREYLVLEKHEEVERFLKFILSRNDPSKEENKITSSQQYHKDRSFTQLLQDTANSWGKPADLSTLIQSWLQFPADLIQVVDRLSLEFDFQGFTATRLYLVEKKMLGIDELYDILLDTTQLPYILQTYSMVTEYFISLDRTELARRVLDEIVSRLPDKGELLCSHDEILGLVALAIYLDHQRFIELIETIYQKYGNNKQLEEFRVNSQNQGSIAIRKLQNISDPVFQPLVEMFSPSTDQSSNEEQVRSFLGQLFDDTTE